MAHAVDSLRTLMYYYCGKTFGKVNENESSKVDTKEWVGDFMYIKVKKFNHINNKYRYKRCKIREWMVMNLYTEDWQNVIS